MLAVASMGGARTPKVLMLSRYEIFMNRLRGRMLNAVMKDGIPADRIIVEVGRQLALLHSMNIVHGDYTPANILVDGNDVWVIDFGLGGISASAEEKALDVLLLKRSIDRKQYRVFEASYAGSYGGSRAVLQRLKEIELRGRYQTRTLMTR